MTLGIGAPVEGLKTVQREASRPRPHRGDKEERMTEAGMLSIVRRGHTYQVHYASSNPYDMDRPPYQCPDEGALVTWLHHCGINAWSLQQAVAALRKGGVAGLLLVLSEAQRQAYFPPQHTPCVCMDAGDAGGQADHPQVTAPWRDVCRTRAHASP